MSVLGFWRKVVVILHIFKSQDVVKCPAQVPIDRDHTIAFGMFIRKSAIAFPA